MRRQLKIPIIKEVEPGSDITNATPMVKVGREGCETVAAATAAHPRLMLLLLLEQKKISFLFLLFFPRFSPFGRIHLVLHLPS